MELALNPNKFISTENEISEEDQVFTNQEKIWAALATAQFYADFEKGVAVQMTSRKNKQNV
ncbi:MULTISPECIES: hypothetical protein [unclassified Lonepinella]|uniref:hypothetical protein n=1 Tax=unclassified Lonepinella TaxID=2642006 RepID=UPI003F6DDF8B